MRDSRVVSNGYVDPAVRDSRVPDNANVAKPLRVHYA
jgi:hypothetical protein